MTKKLTSAQKKNQLNRLLAKYNRRLKSLYDDYIKKLAALDYGEDVLEGDALFNFDNFPDLKARLNNIFNDYLQKNVLCYENGMTDGVALAYEHDNNVLGVHSIFSDKALTAARQTAAATFIQSRLKVKKGLNLAQTVWNYCQQAKSEFEMSMSNVIADGLGKGTSAEELGRKLRQYLNNPDMMYRRYHTVKVQKNGTKKDVATWRRRRIIDGKVRFVEEPLEKVGMGVYRSARKNALRLARTEINAAYLTAHNARWAKESFVIGQHIHLSPQHDPEKDADVCDELEGYYPKEFVWSGWHPQCKCTTDPVLISGDEEKEYDRRSLFGEDMSNYVSPNRIKDMPTQFKRYIEQNADAIVDAYKRDKLAWHLANNKDYWIEYLNAAQRKEMGLTLNLNGDRIKQLANIRHAARDAAKIQRTWTLRRTYLYTERMNNLVRGLTYTKYDTMGAALQARYHAVTDALRNTKALPIRDAERLFEHFKRGVAIRERWDRLLWDGFSKEQIANCRELEKRLGILKGRPMSWEQANNGRENPLYRLGGQYRVNCQTCTVTHELRRRGFNITAKGLDDGFSKMTDLPWKKRFMDADNSGVTGTYSSSWAMSKNYAVMSSKRILEFINSATMQEGRYEIYCAWKKKSAHVFLLNNENGKKFWFDPQSGKRGDAISHYINNMKGKSVIVFRVDNALVAPQMQSCFATTKSYGRQPSQSAQI